MSDGSGAVCATGNRWQRAAGASSHILPGQVRLKRRRKARSELRALRPRPIIGPSAATFSNVAIEQN